MIIVEDTRFFKRCSRNFCALQSNFVQLLLNPDRPGSELVKLVVKSSAYSAKSDESVKEEYEFAREN